MKRKILKYLMISTLLFLQFALNPGYAQMPVYDPATALGSFLGTHERERVGYWLNQAGDVNGDGYDDFIIANYHTQTNGYDAGSTYLILGKSDPNWSQSVSLSQADARFLGEDYYSAMGYHVDGGGDLNGDGLSDFIIGAPAGNEDGKDRPGTAYIIFGRQAADWGFNFVPAYSADAFYDGEVDFDQLGKSVAIVGDLNNDGFDDIVLGAPYHDVYRRDGGKIYIILGKSNGWVTNGNIEQHADASFLSDNEDDQAGYMVSGAGDVNGDGYDDFLIGAPGNGNVYLMFGRSNANWGYNFNLDNADVIFEGEHRSDNLGWIVATAGDVDNDGFDDFLMTTPYNGENGQESGKTYLILGHDGGWSQEFDLATADASYLGEAAYDNSGWTASGVGDINGDNFDDFMIGAWYNDQAGEDAGKGYILYGKATGWQQNVDLATVTEYIVGENEIDYFGFSVSAGGDLNQDGLDDFLVSAPYCNEAFEWGGKIYVFPGERPKYPIDGQVTYFDNTEPVPDVTIKFSGTANDSVFTDNQGNYSWIIPDGRNITVQPRKDRKADQGLMTILSYDAALVARYTVGLETFSSFQRIAADVDKDDNITTYDASLIAQYVVDPESYPPNEIATWTFEPEERNYTEISDTLTEQNFTAIVVGNVHGGWTRASQLAKQKVLPVIAKPDARMAGELLTLPVHVPRGTDLLALDLQLEFDPEKFRLQGIEKVAAIRNFNLNYQVKGGKLTLGLFGVNSVLVDSTVCEIQFQAIGSQDETPEFTFNRFIVNTQAYQTSATRVSGVKNSKPGSYLLEQNYPNPFNPATVINYELPQPARVKIRIYNLMGQEIRTLFDGLRNAGKHQVHWDGKDDTGKDVAAGIYLYRAELGNVVKIRRMLKLM